MLLEEEYWAIFGDRNTSFFHITTVVHRQRNKLEVLLLGLGNVFKIRKELRRWSNLVSWNCIPLKWVWFILNLLLLNFHVMCFLRKIGAICKEWWIMRKLGKPCGVSNPSRHLGLMDYMLVFFSTFGMMSKILFVMKLRKHLAFVSFRSIWIKPWSLWFLNANILNL